MILCTLQNSWSCLMIIWPICVCSKLLMWERLMAAEAGLECLSRSSWNRDLEIQPFLLIHFSDGFSLYALTALSGDGAGVFETCQWGQQGYRRWLPDDMRLLVCKWSIFFPLPLLEKAGRIVAQGREHFFRSSASYFILTGWFWKSRVVYGIWIIITFLLWYSH